MKHKIDLETCRKALTDALRGEFSAAPGVFLKKWAPVLIAEVERLREIEWRMGRLEK
jgi:hypothetical protein